MRKKSKSLSYLSKLFLMTYAWDVSIIYCLFTWEDPPNTAFFKFIFR